MEKKKFQTRKGERRETESFNTHARIKHQGPTAGTRSIEWKLTEFSFEWKWMANLHGQVQGKLFSACKAPYPDFNIFFFGFKACKNWSCGVYKTILKLTFLTRVNELWRVIQHFFNIKSFLRYAFSSLLRISLSLISSLEWRLQTRLCCPSTHDTTLTASFLYNS